MRAGTTDSCAYGTHSAKFRHAGRTKKSKKTFPFLIAVPIWAAKSPPVAYAGPWGFLSP